MQKFDVYVQKFFQGALVAQNFDYSDMKSVRKANRGVDKYRQAVKDIGAFYPQRLQEFASVALQYENVGVCCCAAFAILDLTEPSSFIVEKALNVIFDALYKAKPGTRMGYNFWLNKYFEKHPEYQDMDKRK